MNHSDSIQRKLRMRSRWRGPMLALTAASAAFALAAVASSLIAPTIPAAERQALFDLHERTRGAQWSVRTGWLGAAGT